MQRLAAVIGAALPTLSFQARAVLDALLLTRGRVGTAQQLADRLHLRSRFELAALLRVNGLPPLHRLSAWITMLCWVWDWENTRISLFRTALSDGREPAACYRLVTRMTGMPWTKVRAAGTQQMLDAFLAECTVRRPQPESGHRRLSRSMALGPKRTGSLTSGAVLLMTTHFRN